MSCLILWMECKNLWLGMINSIMSFMRIWFNVWINWTLDYTSQLTPNGQDLKNMPHLEETPQSTYGSSVQKTTRYGYCKEAVIPGWNLQMTWNAFVITVYFLYFNFPVVWKKLHNWRIWKYTNLGALQLGIKCCILSHYHRNMRENELVDARRIGYI